MDDSDSQVEYFKTTLVLFRGLPGSGKTFVCDLMCDYTISADDYFVSKIDGEYHFNPSLLSHAHEDCQGRTLMAIDSWTGVIGSSGGSIKIGVANTFSTRWEMEPYIRMAERQGIDICILDLFDGGHTDEELTKRNSHGVPLKGIQRMRARWEHDWKKGSPTALYSIK